VAAGTGPVTRALLAIPRGGADDRELARDICTAYVAGITVDGAAMSLLTGATDTAMLLMLAAHPRPELGEGGPPDEDRRIDRVEVHQATGMVLVQLAVPVEDAFARLRAYAFAQRRPLNDVARDVVARRLVFTDEMD